MSTDKYDIYDIPDNITMVATELGKLIKRVAGLEEKVALSTNVIDHSVYPPADPRLQHYFHFLRHYSIWRNITGEELVRHFERLFSNNREAAEAERQERERVLREKLAETTKLFNDVTARWREKARELGEELEEATATVAPTAATAPSDSGTDLQALRLSVVTAVLWGARLESISDASCVAAKVLSALDAFDKGN